MNYPHSLALLGLMLFGSSVTYQAQAAPQQPQPKSIHWQDGLRIEVLSDEAMPVFKPEPQWPRLPDNTLLGQVSGVAVDEHDNIWIVQRPKSVNGWELGLQKEPVEALCCKTLPEVIQFSSDGRYLQGWSGAASAPTLDGVSQWPNSMHGVYIDKKGDIWLAGAGDDDYVVLRYNSQGQYKGQFGKRGQWRGNLDQQTLGKPADVYHDEQTGVVYVADGYINRRVLGFSATDYSFLNYFGANATEPQPVPDKKRENHLDLSNGLFNSSADQFSDIVHCIVPSNDGLLYICDRRHNRVQVFKKDPTAAQGVQFVANLPVAPGSALAGTATDIALSPDQRFLYVADMVNGSIWVYKRDNLKLLGRIGKQGRQPGQFIWLHSLTTDSKGNLYTTEVGSGMRVQKLSLTGMSQGAGND